MQGILSYTIRNKLLVVPEHEERIMKRIRTRWRTGPFIYLASILLSFISPVAGFTIYVGALVFLVVQSSSGFRTSHERRENGYSALT